MHMYLRYSNLRRIRHYSMSLLLLLRRLLLLLLRHCYYLGLVAFVHRLVWLRVATTGPSI